MNNRDPSDFPPITVVTAGSNSSSRKLPKNNAPTILLKPPAKQQLSKGGSSSDMTIASRPIGNAPTGSTAVVDGGNINGTGTANTNPNNSASTSDAMNMTMNNDKQVDSALVSALRDKRERMALLRLEKNLVEFMNDKNCGFMEVGGAGNSTVIRGGREAGVAILLPLLLLEHQLLLILICQSYSLYFCLHLFCTHVACLLLLWLEQRQLLSRGVSALLLRFQLLGMPQTICMNWLDSSSWS